MENNNRNDICKNLDDMVKLFRSMEINAAIHMIYDKERKYDNMTCAELRAEVKRKLDDVLEAFMNSDISSEELERRISEI